MTTLPGTLVDPVEKKPLVLEGGSLRAANGRSYPVVEGIPVMLLDDESQTIRLANATLDAVQRGNDGPYYLSTTASRLWENSELQERLARREPDMHIDPVVDYLICATNGQLYEGLVGKLKSYPIPHLKLLPAQGTRQKFLDVGCGWGRWSIAAAQKGYDVTAIDPSLGAILAGRRVADQLGLHINWIVGDARFLPFAGSSFDVVFSYSVFQHFAKPEAKRALKEIGRILKTGGKSLVQMANAYGLRSRYHLRRRGSREAEGFEVRYYEPDELLDLFKSTIGASELAADGFFGLGLQYSDRHMMRLRHKVVLGVSEGLSRLTQIFPPLRFAADSLYIRSAKCPGI